MLNNKDGLKIEIIKDVFLYFDSLSLKGYEEECNGGKNGKKKK